MAERSTRWRDRLGVRLGAAFTATALVAVGAVTAVALTATSSGVSELAAEHRAQVVDDVVAALASAYLSAGGWAEADLLPAHTLAAAAGAVLVVTAPELGELPAPPGLAATRRQLREHAPTIDEHGRADVPHVETPRDEPPTTGDAPADDHDGDDGGHEDDGGAEHAPGEAQTPDADEDARRQGQLGNLVDPEGGERTGADGSGSAPQSTPRDLPRPAEPSGTGGRGQPSARAQLPREHILLGDTVLAAASDPDGYEARSDAAVVVDDREVATATLLFVARDVPDATRTFQDQLGRSLLLGAVLAALVALAITAFVTARLTRPLRLLTADVDRIRRGEPTDRSLDPSTPPGEIGLLTVAIEGMAADLRRQERLRRALVADVGHELRTPVTILLGELEALRDGVLAADADQLASLHEEVQRIARLVEDVDSLADAEAAGFSLTLAPLELAAVVEEAARGFGTPLAAAELTLVTALDHVEVVGDHRRLEQVVRNLLSNAAKYAPPGTNIEVTLRRDGDAAMLRVADRGPGFDPDELPHVFERFWRGHAASGRGGSGIGLAVVAEVVHAHGGRTTAANRPGGGAVLTVEIPATSPDPQDAGSDRRQPNTVVGSGRAG
jgi:signal transduction histidine kinase